MTTPLPDPDSAGADATAGTHPAAGGVRGSATPPPVASAGSGGVPPAPHMTRASSEVPPWPSASEPTAPSGYPPAPDGQVPAPAGHIPAPHGFPPAPISHAPGSSPYPPQTAPGSPAFPGFGAPPSAYAAARDVGANAYRAPWQTPDGSAYGAALEAATPARSGRLGVTALVLSIIALVVAPALGAIGFAGIAPAFRTRLAGGGDLVSDLTWLAPVAGFELMAELAFYLGTITGVIAVTAGIIAVVQRRGRRAGIVAVVLGLIAPFVFVGAGVLTVAIG